MNREYLLKLTAEFSDNSATNYLSPKAEDKEALEKLANNFYTNNFGRNNYYGTDSAEIALNKDKDEKYVGMRFFMPPLLSVGSASDEGFRKLKDPKVVGPHHLMPEDWLPEAKSVISLFLPFADRVIASNSQDPNEPSWEWLYTRVDGQQHLLATGSLVRDALIREGYKAVVPYADDRYLMRVSHSQEELPIPAYSSNWSERHVAYLTGLGTFGRSTNFITKRGACGRLISIITDWETEPDAKDYQGVYDYCSECGVSYRACPGNALSGSGKDIDKCSAFLGVISKKYAPRYGCGKCQSGLPCSVRNLTSRHRGK
jgi:epoxyqueuosine reductase